jgi:short-subunit dehydrogenase
MRSLKGKRALVTGAASGIGREIANELAGLGPHLYLVDMDREGAERTARDIRRKGVSVFVDTCDLADPDQISACLRRLLERWQYLDIVVNNAGVAYFGPTDSMTAKQRDRLLATNLLGPVQLVHELLPTLKARDESHILNVASMCGLVGGNKLAVYSASKFGIQGFSESLRVEVARFGVGVTSICPGFTRTRIFDNGLNSQGGRGIRKPPKWVTTSPTAVARRSVRAIKLNEPLVVITPLAKAWWFAKRLFSRALFWIAAFHFSGFKLRRAAPRGKERLTAPLSGPSPRKMPASVKVAA